MRSLVRLVYKEKDFKVRSVTRNPNKYQGKADEVVHGDLMDLESLTNALKDAHGVFVVTNFWEGADELAQGHIAVEAAKKANVNHFVWSTLPNVEKISNGRLRGAHFGPVPAPLGERSD